MREDQSSFMDWGNGTRVAKKEKARKGGSSLLLERLDSQAANYKKVEFKHNFQLCDSLNTLNIPMVDM